MKTKIFVLFLIISILTCCSSGTKGPKKMYTTDISTGVINIPAQYIGGVEGLGLKKKTKGNLLITNTYLKFVTKKGNVYFELPINSIRGVLVGEDTRGSMDKLIAKSPYGLIFGVKGKEVISIELKDEEKNIIFTPMFMIKVGTGKSIKQTIESKAGVVKK